MNKTQNYYLEVKMEQVVGYYRTSSNSNVGQDKDSRKRQQHAVMNYASSNGMTVVSEFYDKGVSGTKEILNRPSFMKMLDYCEDNEISTIVLEDASRMSRDLIIQETGFQYLTTKLGYKLVSVANPDTFVEHSPTGTLIRQVLGTIAQFEKSNLVEKLRVARERKSIVNKRKGIIARSGKGKVEGKKRITERTPYLTELVVSYRKKIDRRTHQPYSYRKISKLLQEKNEISISYQTVNRILDDVVFMKKEERNRTRRKI